MGTFGEEAWMLFWGHPQLIVEGVVPDFYHVFPVSYDAVVDGVFQI